MTTRIPDRIRWALEILDPAPDDDVLEVGCGPGVAVALTAQRLSEGTILAIDRSAAAIARTRRRVEAHIVSGRVELRETDLARLRCAPDRFDKAFAVNVNVFWTGDARPECAVLARVVRTGGVVHLVYEGPGGTRDVAPTVASNLERHGFETKVTRGSAGRGLCVSGRC